MTTPIRTAKAGDVFDGPVLHLTLPRVLAFSGGLFGEPGWPARNLHTDVVKAHEAGLPAIIVSGTQFEGHLVDFLVDLFGEDAWFRHGVLQVRIPKSVLLDDRVQPRVVITSVETAHGSVVYAFEVASSTQSGTVVLKGTGTCRTDDPAG